jgi:hypothetical protein
VELVPYNLLEQSNAFSTSPWSKSAGTTLTSGQTDPNGGATAFRMQMSSASNFLASGIFTVVSGSIYTYTIYIKSNTGSNQSFRIIDGVIGVSGGVLTGTATTQWQRFEVQINLNSTIGAFQLDNNGGAYSNDLLIAFSQVVEGSTAKDYQKTETRLNIPRLDYSNGTCPSLLVEPQRTNLALYSEQFDNAYWRKNNITITSSTESSPTSDNNSFILQVNGTLGFHTMDLPSVNRIPVQSGVTYTSSVFVKKDPTSLNNIIQLVNRIASFGNSFANFNINTGIVTKEEGCTARIVPLNNGWYRISITATATASGTNDLIVIFTNNNPDSDITPIYTGSTDERIIIWGAQLEAGSYPTSYIPTTSASVTRNADGNGTLINAQTLNDFVLFYDGLFFDDNVIIFGSGANSAWYVSLSPSLNRVVVDLASGRKYESFNGNIVINQRIKIAIKRASGVIDIFLNGVKLTPNIQVTDTTALSLSSVGWSFSSTFFGRGRMNSAAAWQISLSDAQCQTLTTI